MARVVHPTTGFSRGGSFSRWTPSAAFHGSAGSHVDKVYIHLYTVIVRFSWDQRKSERNFRDRGFDFEFATLIFEGPTLEREDTRRDYGERRVVAIGIAQGMALTVVYTDRADAGGVVRRIISARLSDRHERQAYVEAVSRP
jgi:uncharacterized DUF497 family protein